MRGFGIGAAVADGQQANKFYRLRSESAPQGQQVNGEEAKRELGWSSAIHGEANKPGFDGSLWAASDLGGAQDQSPTIVFNNSPTSGLGLGDGDKDGLAGDKRSVITPLVGEPLAPYPEAIIPKVRPPDHTTEEDALRQSLVDNLGSPIMYVTAVWLNPLAPEAFVRVHLKDRAITPDPLGGGRRGRILREGYRIAQLAVEQCHKRPRDLRFVTISALSQLSSSGGPGPVEEVWQGRVNVTLLGAGDDRASAAEVGKVFDPQMYWNPIAGF